MDPAADTFARRIDGNFTGTTDEIIRWGACKWGFDEDIVRAVAVNESYWRQSQLGDLVNGPFSAPQTHAQFEIMCHLAEMVAALDHTESAAALYPLLEPWGQLLLVNQVNYQCPVAHLIGGLATTLERFDEADRHLAYAEEVCAAVPLPYWLQETRLARARALFRRARPGDRDAAQRLVNGVLATAGECGFAGVAGKADRLLADVG